MAFVIVHRCAQCGTTVRWHRRKGAYVHADHNAHDHDVSRVNTEVVS